jgi:hypothetical protein
MTWLKITKERREEGAEEEGGTVQGSMKWSEYLLEIITFDCGS